MTAKSKIILLIFIFWLLSSGLSAEETLKEASTGSDSLEYTLPEVIVRGDNSLYSLEMEVIRAEELKFEVFNNLNSTDDFDITCEWHATTGTRIKQWSCDVAYMKKARTEDIQDALYSGRPVRTDHDLTVQFADKTRALNREMKALAIQYPELAVAMVNAHELKQLYIEVNRKRYKDSIFVGNSREPDLKLNKLDIWAAAFQDHSNGVISDEIWARWDSMYRKLFRLKSYRNMWKSANYSKYGDEFVAYINTIMAGK